MTKNAPAGVSIQRNSMLRRYMRRHWVLYAMLLLPVLYYIIFKYVPMVGNVLAFRRYRPGMSPFGTEWTMRYFERFCAIRCSGARFEIRWSFRCSTFW